MARPRLWHQRTFGLQKFQAAAAGDRKAVLAEAEKVAAGVSGTYVACRNCRLLAALACYLCWCSQWTARASPARFCAGTDGLVLPHALAASGRTLVQLLSVLTTLVLSMHLFIHAEDDKENAALYVRFMKKAVEKVRGLLLVY